MNSSLTSKSRRENREQKLDQSTKDGYEQVKTTSAKTTWTVPWRSFRDDLEFPELSITILKGRGRQTKVYTS